MIVKTRFAPSPTGLLHLGNARTALFNALLARRRGGVFLLRIEDTDPARSRAEHVEALQADLRWLGLQWDEGPDADAAHGPYHQSARSALYAEYFAQLEAAAHVYPCFCTPRELELSRKAQRAAGQAPRYAGTCRHLSAEEVAARRARGLEATLRFRVPRGRVIAFDDLVRGPQQFVSDVIGDFIIRKVDGSPAFFFCNAVDDALMGVTHVLRGEDHLTNTPRQLLLLEALGLSAPSYGHIALILGTDGAPLSKRNGSRSLQGLRHEGFLPEAVCNHLARLGHVYEHDTFMSPTELAAGFELQRLGRAPARHDEVQLRHWQREAVARADAETLWDWLHPAVEDLVPDGLTATFVEAVRGNVLLPEDARLWAERLFTDDRDASDAAHAAVAAAGPAFFTAALELLPDAADDFGAYAKAIGKAVGVKGKALFMPLRAALTGETHGPEMTRVFPLLGRERAGARLQRAAQMAANAPSTATT